MRTRIFTLIMLLGTATGAVADDMKMPVNAAQIKWEPAPNFVPKGAQIAVLSGDPSKDGLYVVRLNWPAGYKIPAHNHPTMEMVTVISGNFHLGMGDKLDEKKGMQLTAGGYAEAPAKMNHFVSPDRGSNTRPRTIRHYLREPSRRSTRKISIQIGDDDPRVRGIGFRA